MTYLTDDEIKAELFSLLCSFDGFAEANGLRYTLLGGTLLGAVRHKGFIPWDDDLDVGMPRPDYQQLLSLADRLPAGTALVYLDEHSPRPFVKFECVNVFCQEDTAQEIERLWVDVFPLDGMPDNDQLCMHQLQRMLHQKKRAGRRRAILSGAPWKRSAKKLFRPALNAIESVQSIYRKMDDMAQEYPFGTTRRCRDIVWGESTTAFYLTSDFDHLSRLEFCGRKFPAVAHWDETLRSVYGDYMKLPPEDQRVNHGLKAWRLSGSDER